MPNELFKFAGAIVLGLILAVLKFPSEKLDSKLRLTPVSGFAYRFIIGVFLGLTLIPTFEGTQKHIVSFVTTQPDFIVNKAYKLILSVFGIVGFYAGMKVGKKKASNTE